MGAVVTVVVDKFPTIRRALPKIAKAVAKVYIDAVYDISQDLVPVDTGELKESGTVTEMSSGYKLTYSAKNRSGQDYAGYVEYGTAHTRAQPYVNPAAQAALGMLGNSIDIEEMIAEVI